MLSKAQKQPQCTCQDKTVVGNSLTPPVALLVHPSGISHLVANEIRETAAPVSTSITMSLPSTVSLTTIGCPPTRNNGKLSDSSLSVSGVSGSVS